MYYVYLVAQLNGEISLLIVCNPSNDRYSTCTDLHCKSSAQTLHERTTFSGFGFSSFFFVIFDFIYIIHHAGAGYSLTFWHP